MRDCTNMPINRHIVIKTKGPSTLKREQARRTHTVRCLAANRHHRRETLARMFVVNATPAPFPPQVGMLDGMTTLLCDEPHREEEFATCGRLEGVPITANAEVRRCSEMRGDFARVQPQVEVVPGGKWHVAIHLEKAALPLFTIDRPLLCCARRHKNHLRVVHRSQRLRESVPVYRLPVSLEPQSWIEFGERIKPWPHHPLATIDQSPHLFRFGHTHLLGHSLGRSIHGADPLKEGRDDKETCLHGSSFASFSSHPRQSDDLHSHSQKILSI